MSDESIHDPLLIRDEVEAAGLQVADALQRIRHWHHVLFQAIVRAGVVCGRTAVGRNGPDQAIWVIKLYLIPICCVILRAY